ANFTPPSMRCSFCSADIFAVSGFFSICAPMYCRQLTRWLIPTHTAKLNTVRRIAGRIQLGLRTMSSKVAFGEKNTPVIRPNRLIAACASGAGIDVVVAIAHTSTTASPPKGVSIALCCLRAPSLQISGLTTHLTNRRAIPQPKWHSVLGPASATPIPMSALRADEGSRSGRQHFRHRATLKPSATPAPPSTTPAYTHAPAAPKPAPPRPLQQTAPRASPPPALPPAPPPANCAI